MRAIKDESLALRAPEGLNKFGASCGVRCRPGYLSTLNYHLGVAHCRQHVSKTTLVDSLLLPRLTPLVALVRERRSVTAQAGGAISSSAPRLPAALYGRCGPPAQTSPDAR